MLQPLDILLAFKAVALSEHLNGTEKQFAAFLIDSFNRVTGRCDPSEETAAFLLGKSPRTIVRAGNRLVELKLFVRRKHAGHNHCNSYLPNWQFFRESEDRYKIRRKEHASRFARQKMSHSECQPSHLDTDNPVTQTSPKNNIQLTYPAAVAVADANRQPAEREKGRLSNMAKFTTAFDKKLRYLGPSSSRDAAESSAERRWNNALFDRFGTGPAYAVIVEALDVALQEAATCAELKRRGAGITCILETLTGRGIQWENGRWG
jgi:hypothetical protein